MVVNDDVSRGVRPSLSSSRGFSVYFLTAAFGLSSCRVELTSRPTKLLRLRYAVSSPMNNVTSSRGHHSTQDLYKGRGNSSSIQASDLIDTLCPGSPRLSTRSRFNNSTVCVLDHVFIIKWAALPYTSER